MAVEPWNKVNIPSPATTASCRISFNIKTAKVAEDVILYSNNVLKLLNSDVLQTEIQVLRKILYVVQNSLRQHKTFRAIKQVEQCIGRLHKMKLQESLQDLQDLCPNIIQRNDGVDLGHCYVPSQPMLEWFSLKLLGASSLLGRTLKKCLQAFLLSRQHLCLSEFIVLNLVVVSLLSRLWVFFRGILTAFIPLYRSIKNLLDVVIQCHPIAFLTNFTLPMDMTMFSDLAHCNLLLSQPVFIGIRENKKHSFLDRLFNKEAKDEEENAKKESIKMMQLLADEGGPSLILDIKSRLQHAQDATKSSTADTFIKASSAELSASNLHIVERMKKFLTQLKGASSIGDVKDHLKEMIEWCRSCKLHQEHSLLVFTLLRFQKMQAERKGTSVQKTLIRRLCLRLSLLLIEKALPRHFSFQCKTKRFLTTRFTTLMTRYGSVKHQFKLRMCCGVSRELQKVKAKPSKICKNSKKDMGVSSVHAETLKSGGIFSVKKKKNLKPASNIDEIDEIFSCIV